MTTPKPWFRQLREHAAAGPIEIVGALAGLTGAIWQRLTFERVLTPPPETLVIVFWVSSFAFLAAHLLSQNPARRAAAGIVLVASVVDLWRAASFQMNAIRELEAYRFAMAAYFSSTWRGLPLSALLAMLATLVWTWLIAESIPWRPGAFAVSAAFLLFGATTVLGYATGSPWPFGT